MKPLPELVELYCEDLRLRGLAVRTVFTRRHRFTYLSRYFDENEVDSLETVTTAILEDFRRWLYYTPTTTGRLRAVSDQNRILSAIKDFFRFLKKAGYLTYDPSESIAFAKESRSLPKDVLTPREAKKILEKIDTSTLVGYRDRTILEVFYSTGIRLSELIDLNVMDVDIDGELLRINEGKGGHDRVVPLSGIACRYLESYLNGIRSKLLKNRECDALFLSWRGRRLNGTAVGELVRKHARKARVKKKVSPHLWRHTCATHLIKNNANLRHVQAMLGHRCLVSTERYLHLTINDLKAAHKKCHPREHNKGKDN